MDIFGKRKIAELEGELSKSKEKLRRCEDTNDNLNKEIERLTDEINAENTDCNVGSWCNECKYSSIAYMANRNNVEHLAKNYWMPIHNDYTTIRYCSKHLREICPEFKKKVDLS